MKRRWVFLTATVAVLALGALMTGAAFAQEADNDGKSGVGKLGARVAQILGLDETEVNDAIKQARTELQNEATQERLEKMVEAGKITQEQADEYLAWFESRPADGPGLGHRGFGGKKRGHHGRGMRGHRGHFGAPQAPADATPPADGSSL
ncbi:MAG: hypothetical protein QF898_08175 [SAR202 cluster bacterium]|jgi:hypothetical protein|nr:hypothetical protein [SAR202 cluster bacterium]MDP6512462.1 hypothetical protein [SAR202 cluster bacterium]MDP6714122.1 hypothetical protein [SAR202 cluster bacterium]